MTLEKVTDRVYASINPAGGNAGIIILQDQVVAVRIFLDGRDAAAIVGDAMLVP